jgi:hypothetical protein
MRYRPWPGLCLATPPPSAAVAALAAQADSTLEWARLALLAVLAALAWLEGDRRRRLLVVLAVAVPVVAVVGLAVLAKSPPPRVAVPLLAFAGLLLLLRPHAIGDVPETSADRRTRPVLRWLAVAVTISVIGIGATDAVRLSSRNEAGAIHLQKRLDSLEAFDPDGVFVSWQDTMGIVQLLPWQHDGLESPDLIPLGWQQRSPMHEAWMQSHGIDDLYAAIAARDDIYLPLYRGQQRRSYLRYLEEHYGFPGLLRPAALVGPYTVYNLVAAFEVDRGREVLIERRFDGTALSYRIISAEVGRRAIALPLWRSGLLLIGRAAADLVVVTANNEAVALAVPGTGSAGSSNPANFAVTVRSSQKVVRVFAISGDTALEITP